MSLLVYSQYTCYIIKLLFYYILFDFITVYLILLCFTLFIMFHFISLYLFYDIILYFVTSYFTIFYLTLPITMHS